MNDYEINDVRTKKDFQSYTFSNYKKSEVKKQLLNDMFKGKIENSCYWTTELICAGHFMELWELILFYACKHIHLGNPMLPAYINLRFQHFKEIVSLTCQAFYLVLSGSSLKFSFSNVAVTP